MTEDWKQLPRIISCMLLSSLRQSACIVFGVFGCLSSANCASGPFLPLCGMARLIDNFICSWREAGDQYDLSFLCGDGETRGRSFSIFSPLPGRTSGPLHARLSFNSDEWSHFSKSVRSVIKNVRCEGFFCRCSALACRQVMSVFLLISSLSLHANETNCVSHSRVTPSIFWRWCWAFVPDLSDVDCCIWVSIVAGKETWDGVVCCL